MAENAVPAAPAASRELVPESALVGRVHASPNFGPRNGGLGPTILLMHYTGMPSCARAIDWLSRPESSVSSHYVIDVDGTITQLIAEHHRAWHAGVSVWRGQTDINSASIGIEIHNPGHGEDYCDFPDAQMQAVADLSAEIIARWRIAPEGVLAHSDVAPGRKIDPGERFDWKGLADLGIGRWVEPEPTGPLIVSHSQQSDPATITHVQRLLASYGYGLPIDGRLDAHARKVISSFQLHFRPSRVDGVIDPSTIATLERLIDASDLAPAS